MATVDDKLIEVGHKLSTVEKNVASLSRQVFSDLNPKINTVEARIGSLETALGALQRTIPAPTPTPSRFDRLMALADPISKIIIPFLILVMTWNIKDSLELALKQRELDVTTGKAMQDALTKLRSAKGLTQEEADAAALVLASMGKPSIMPLIREYDSGTAEASVAVGKALFLLGLTHKSELCDSLKIVIADQGKRFRIGTYRLAVEQIGQAQCEKVAELSHLKYLLGDPNRYAGRFSIDPTSGDVDELRKGVENALERLEP